MSYIQHRHGSDSAADLWSLLAAGVMADIEPVLVWIEGNAAGPLSSSDTWAGASYAGLASILERRRFLLARPNSTEDLDLSAMPACALERLRRYVRELPGFDPALPMHEQRSSVPADNHGYTLHTAIRLFDPVTSANDAR